MLRISAERERDTLSLVLEGRLVGPWVEELRTIWREHDDAKDSLQLTVDLCGLTAMDTAGQRLLDELLQDGATLRCSDVMNQYLVEQMIVSSGGIQEACRPCRRFPNQTDFSAGAGEAELVS